MKTRREEVEEILELVHEYLSRAGWGLDHNTFLRIDPVTRCKYPNDVAFCIQTTRDLAEKKV